MNQLLDDRDVISWHEEETDDQVQADADEREVERAEAHYSPSEPY